MKDSIRKRVERFKDCPNCGRKQSMVIGIYGWICLNCFHRISLEEEVKKDEKKDEKN